ncbi:RDD family protein [Kitasatospora sp. NPDC093679]|uniref:RDD family protein n=1 Tax=Kitasatospora sp. NPDC093679 TaxID=3154983 RepID=UPI00341592B4
MTDRPNGGAADTAVGPMPGYYPDPSIPGFVRYWGGTGWVPGTTRPAPAEGEVLEPPRIVSRQTPPLVPPTAAPPAAVAASAPPVSVQPAAPAAPGASAGAAPAVPSPAVPSPAEPPDAEPGSGSGSASAEHAGVEPAPGEPAQAGVPAPAMPSLPDWPSPPLSDSDTQTGPVYFDETSAGASFVMAAHAEVELRPRADVEPVRAEQPALRHVPPTLVPPPAAVVVPSARSAPPETLTPAAQPSATQEAEERVPAARSGGSGWQADPRAQRGLLETGAAPRWVSWGVLPTGAEAEFAEVEHAAAPPSFPAPAPVRAPQALQAAPGAVAAPGAEAAEPQPAENSAAHSAAPEPVVAEEEPEAPPTPGATVEAEPDVSAVTEPAPAEPVAAEAVPAVDALSEVPSVEPARTVSEPARREERVPREASATALRPEAARSAAPQRAASRSPEPGAGAAAPRVAERPAPVSRPPASTPSAPPPSGQAASGRRAAEQRPAEQRPATAARKAVPKQATKQTSKPAPKPAALQSAGLGRRLAARIVDSLLVLVVAAAAGVPLGTEAVAHVREKLDQARAASALAGHEVRVWLVDGVVLGKAGVLIGVLVVFGVLYEVLPTARTGQTFGKRLVRIRVVDARGGGSGRRTPPSFGRSLVRWAVRQLSVLMPVGLLWPLFDRRARRGWQDRAAATRVVKG